MVESLHFDIQSTGQKSHRVSTGRRPSRCSVLIRQSDSPGPCQFRADRRAPDEAARPGRGRRRSWGGPREGPGDGPGSAPPRGGAEGLAQPLPVPVPLRTPARPARSPEPILVPRLRIRFADFPYLHCSVDQRLFTSETCCGRGYGPARESHRLPGIFTGRRGRSGRRGRRGALRDGRPYLRSSRFQGVPPLRRKENSSRDPRRRLPVRLRCRAGPRGADLRGRVREY